MAGKPRVVSVTNTGTVPALSLQVTWTPALPVGTTVNAGCTTLAPGASCTITITPGARSTAAAGVTPVPTVLSVAGSNTNTVTTEVLVLTHGSVYQSGYVFSLNDGTPNTGSVGGKAAALSNAPSALLWSTNGGLGGDGIPGSSDDASIDPVPGIDEQSVAGPGACNGSRDGACNSRLITGFYPDVDKSLYAAGACAQPKDGHADWVLPAICELAGVGAGCGAVDSVQSRLLRGGILTAAQFPPGGYWSSTTVHANPDGTAWALTTLANTAFPAGKGDSLAVRCVRTLTP